MRLVLAHRMADRDIASCEKRTSSIESMMRRLCRGRGERWSREHHAVPSQARDGRHLALSGSRRGMRRESDSVSCCLVVIQGRFRIASTSPSLCTRSDNKYTAGRGWDGRLLNGIVGKQSRRQTRGALRASTWVSRPGYLS
jgi:hypothetical protein